MHPRFLAFGFLAALALGVTIACGQPPAAPDARPNARPIVSPTPPTSAPTPQTSPTASPAPSSTPAPETPETPAPVATNTPQPDPEPTAEPTQASPEPAEVRALSHWKDESGRRFGDVWSEGTFAYIGHAYDGGGVEILDIGDPANPVHAATWLPPSGDTRSQDVVVREGIGYFGAEGGTGVHVVDVRDPYNPRTIFTIDKSYGGVDYFHNLFVDGHHLYIADNRSPGIRVFDVREPSRPVKAGMIVVPNAPKVHDVTVAGGRLYASGGHHVHIFDVADIGEPRFLGAFEVGEKSHSNWPTSDGQYLAVANEVHGGTVTIWDIRQPGAATKAATLDPHELGFGDVSAHNPVIVGDVLYVSWLTAGLQLFDISNPAAPRHIGGFDTTNGAPPKPLGGGNWGVFPFFGHDLVLASDEHEGLWILDASGVVE